MNQELKIINNTIRNEKKETEYTPQELKVINDSLRNGIEYSIKEMEVVAGLRAVRGQLQILEQEAMRDAHYLPKLGTWADTLLQIRMRRWFAGILVRFDYDADLLQRVKDKRQGKGYNDTYWVRHDGSWVYRD